MKPIGVTLTSIATIWSLAAQAALPPQYQRLKELRAIMDDVGIMAAFDIRHPVDRIEHVEHDLYRVSGGNCHRDVGIKDDPTAQHTGPWSGPRAFILDPRPLVCD